MYFNVKFDLSQRFEALFLGIACFTARFYSSYKLPRIPAPQFISPPKTTYKDVYIGSSLWF